MFGISRYRPVSDLTGLLIDVPGIPAKHRPWKPVVVIRFEDDVKAEAFERYLKFGSGHAFAAKHFW
jgi:hypothetical protein